jgi:hypothetical protein
MFELHLGMLPKVSDVTESNNNATGEINRSSLQNLIFTE